MYQVLEVSLADVKRLYRYKLEDLYMADFNLKGFDYPWLLSSRHWAKWEKVLDVGAAYSPLPVHIYRTHGCEVWAVDDFGTRSNEPFWLRGSSPHQHIASHPEIKYVLERLGDPEKSSLPLNYFDVVYSLSTLEHVPPFFTPAVWRHMDRLLKLGGEMLHAIDIAFPSNGGVRKILTAILFDAVCELLPRGLRQRKCHATPRAYTRHVFKILGIRHPVGRELSTLNMVLNPEILTEGYEIGLNRIIKDKMTNFRFQRVASLMIRLKKLS